MQHQLDWLDAHDAATCIDIVFPFPHHKSSEGSTSSHVTSTYMKSRVWAAAWLVMAPPPLLDLLIHSGRIDSLNKQTSWYSIKQTKQFFVLWFLACSMSPVKRTDICSCQKYIAAHMAAIYHMHMWMETGSTASSIIWRIEIWAIQLELDICLFSCSRYQDDLFNSMELVSLQLHFSM